MNYQAKLLFTGSPDYLSLHSVFSTREQAMAYAEKRADIWINVTQYGVTQTTRSPTHKFTKGHLFAIVDPVDDYIDNTTVATDD